MCYLCLMLGLPWGIQGKGSVFGIGLDKVERRKQTRGQKKKKKGKRREIKEKREKDGEGGSKFNSNRVREVGNKLPEVLQETLGFLVCGLRV